MMFALKSSIHPVLEVNIWYLRIALPHDKAPSVSVSAQRGQAETKGEWTKERENGEQMGY